MNNYNLTRIVFLLFLYAARPPQTKLTNSNQHKGFTALKLLKPFQAKQTKRVDIEDYQKNTMEWVHKRLILFIQNIDHKIFLNKKFKKTAKLGTILEKVPDKKTVFSMQWEDMKSHFLIPISKRHIHLYTDETINELEKIKKPFLDLLREYFVKLQNFENEESINREEKFNPFEKSNFNSDTALIAEKTALHHEVYSLLKDLPQRMMFWKPWETELLKSFALALGPLSLHETAGQLQQKRENFGGDIKGTKLFTAADLDGEEEVVDSEKPEDSDSDSSSSSSDSSSSDSDEKKSSDYDTDFFNNLALEYFLDSGDERVIRAKAQTTIPPESHEDSRLPPESHQNSHLPPESHRVGDSHLQPGLHRDSAKPSIDPSESDAEVHRKLKSLEEDDDWEVRRALSRERQIQEEEPEKRRQDLKHNPELEEFLKKLHELFLSLIANPELRNSVNEKYPDVISDIEKLKELASNDHRKKSISPSAHSSEHSSPLHPGNNGRNSDNIIQGSSEVVRPSAQSSTVHSGSDPGPNFQPPSPIQPPEKISSGPPKPAAPSPPTHPSLHLGPDFHPSSPGRTTGGPSKPPVPSIGDIEVPPSHGDQKGTSLVGKTLHVQMSGDLSVKQEKET